MNVEVSGAKILFKIPVFGGIPITETVVNTWIVMAIIVLFCIFLTRNMKVRPTGRRQLAAEYLVKMVNNLVRGNMGEGFMPYVPLIGALFSMIMLCSLLGLVDAYCPTRDLSSTAAWAAMVFVLITYYKIRTQRLGGYLKSFTTPIFIMTPLNVISEFATPLSMAFRLFGNIASGSVITLLIYAALASLSKAIFGIFANWYIPIFQVGIPAVLSIYFDVFTAVLQAFIFCMLTMMNIKLACEE